MICITIIIIPMHIVIYTSYRPLFTQILPTRHIITLTNQVYRIGLTRINICPSLNIMNKTRTIITTLHRVSGDTTHPSHMVKNLTFIYSFSRSTYRRKIRFKKSYEAFLQSTRQNQNLTDSQAHNDFQIQDPYSIFEFPPQEEEPRT